MSLLTKVLIGVAIYFVVAGVVVWIVYKNNKRKEEEAEYEERYNGRS